MEERNKDFESVRKRSSRRRRSTSANAGNKAVALLQNKYTIVVVVVIVLIALVLGLSMCGKETGVDDTTTTEAQTTDENETTEVDPSNYELQQDAIPQINELVDTYFDVMKKPDAQGYMNIVAGDEMTQDKLAKKGEFIEDYQNIECYTKPGMVEGTYVAFVYYEIKFHNIDTLAPAMIRLYICSNEDGSMYINAGELDQELTAYINTISNDEQLRLLVSQTNQRLDERCAADEKLDALIQLLIKGVEIETEPETTEAEDESGELEFEERDEKVITTTSVRVRSTPSTDSDDNILGKIAAGEEVKRIGYNINWSKIIYNGKEAYVSSDYVITK